MDFTFKIEAFRQQDCTLRVCYSADGVSDRRAFVSLPPDVLKRQDPVEMRTFIVSQAPIKAWNDELALANEVVKPELIAMINREEPFVVPSDEYTAVVEGDTSEPVTV